VCGDQTTFAFNPWVLPDPLKRQLDAEPLDAYLQRESMFCRHCISNLRVRSLATVITRNIAPSATSLRAALDDPDVAELTIAEVNAIGSGGSMHQFLVRHPGLRYSEYREGARPGEVVNGVPHQDLTELTFEDGSIDLLVTSDTIEHLPDTLRAFSECLRVLTPSGLLIFTVPMTPLTESTLTRAEIDEHGEVVHLLEPVHHGRGSGPLALLPMASDMLAFYDFGLDIIDSLGDVGFSARLEFGDEAHRTSGASAVVVATPR
jgi:SAM-dependent methyltransferase